MMAVLYLLIYVCLMVVQFFLRVDGDRYDVQ